jgi:hypothetical protein
MQDGIDDLVVFIFFMDERCQQIFYQISQSLKSVGVFNQLWRVNAFQEFGNSFSLLLVMQRGNNITLLIVGDILASKQLM